MGILAAGGQVIELLPATGDDLEFAWSLYRDLMKPLTEEVMSWDDQSQRAVVKQSLAHQGTSIITIDDANAGWLQVDDTSSGIHLGQIYILPALQNRGVGSAILKRLCDQARREDKAVFLEVMKNNPARAFYEALGFRVTGQSKYKFEMRWQAMG